MKKPAFFKSVTLKFFFQHILMKIIPKNISFFLKLFFFLFEHITMKINKFKNLTRNCAEIGVSTPGNLATDLSEESFPVNHFSSSSS